MMAWYLNDPSERLYWGYLVTSVLLALMLSFIQYRKLPQISAIKRWLTHRDTRLDVGYFFVIWAIKALVIAPLMLSAQVVAMATYQLSSQFLEPIYRPIRYEWLVIAYTVSLFLVSDFTRYWLHRWLHSNRFLWSFHKVHHSPEVLNPLSFYRVHPVENILFGLRYAFSAGLVTGVFMALFGARFNLYTVFGVNITIVIFSALGANLRHSPVRLSYGRWLEHIFISPAQHQIHHATKHMHHNYGGYLAVWDWLFGSLKCNHEVEKNLQIGLGRGQFKKYNTIIKMIIYPIKESGRLIYRSLRKNDYETSNHHRTGHKFYSVKFWRRTH
ncbi:sterol desaturase family protein [Suttonella sp. R2A3]|uniref:sterol desaturase family protein n=1 Tax=Suttonella sp. R2A3 TaxID=2908648 RepID=UPI001F202079|nr:sterol desaturase family protein [Suttonella sp. R2A3]UJF25100.1 sterol desaturase family protein [Suttonella sp. R2A3]